MLGEGEPLHKRLDESGCSVSWRVRSLLRMLGMYSRSGRFLTRCLLAQLLDYEFLFNVASSKNFPWSRCTVSFQRRLVNPTFYVGDVGYKQTSFPRSQRLSECGVSITLGASVRQPTTSAVSLGARRHSDW